MATNRQVDPRCPSQQAHPWRAQKTTNNQLSFRHLLDMLSLCIRCCLLIHLEALAIERAKRREGGGAYPTEVKRGPATG